MASEWRPANDPPEIPLDLIAHEDFVRTVAFNGPVNSFPSGTAAELRFYESPDPDLDPTATWAGTPDGTEIGFEVDYLVVDTLEPRGYYRLFLILPTPDNTANPTREQCLAHGDYTRK
ncbi:hypothetical protein ACFYVR_16095 [Rhodococcus sp. NPDC003318]|uniref:LtfC-like domain-containing protein n=1 Tax=Rhodococcus sp. NPDC003318 TaxID=3364503 RepID=UPI003692ED1C